MPDRPGLAYGFGNNAQYWNQLGTAGATVGSVKGVVSFYAASAAGALCALYCAEAATALPEANNAAMKATAYLESVGVPVTAKIASKLMSEATPSGKPGWGAAVKQMAHELHQIVSNYRQMQSVR
jgi:formylmethanofuran:tetrahydromethanopterin formyltransferase